MAAVRVSDTVIAIRDQFRGKIGQTKVKRYWPGKAPEWADDKNDDADHVTIPVLVDKFFDGKKDDRDDPRLRRLAESRRNNGDNIVQTVGHRRIQRAEIISSNDGDEEGTKGQDSMDFDEEDEDALEERRKRMKEKLLLLMRQQEQEDVEKVLEEDDDEEEECSEYETDSDEELMGGGIGMIKPYFVPKLERDTIAERQRIEEKERALEELVNKRLEERRMETKTLVVEKIREDEEIHNNNNNNGIQLEANNAIDVDTDDENDREEEFKAWEARNIARMKRDREEREATLKDNEEIDKARKMTEEERREYWERLQKTRPESEPGVAIAQPGKRKWAFMQRYYHKGAFFQSDADDPRGTAGTDNIYSRDFSVPTGEDKMNKTILPKSLQVKHFGRNGRTKWTHLVNEDTTNNRNDPTTSTLN